MLIVEKIIAFIVKNWRVGLIVVVAIAVLSMGWCIFKPKPAKLDEKAIQAAQKAIADNDRATMEKILVESDVKEKQIDGTISNSKMDTYNAIEESKKKVSTMTNEELAAELNRRASQ